MLVVYNRSSETHTENNYPIYRPYILGNPYTNIDNRETKAQYVLKRNESPIEAYSHYFDVMYNGNKEFKAVVDEIYLKYKNGEDVWLECYCKPKPCHGDIIVKKLRARLMKEKIDKYERDHKS